MKDSDIEKILKKLDGVLVVLLRKGVVGMDQQHKVELLSDFLSDKELANVLGSTAASIGEQRRKMKAKKQKPSPVNDA